MRYLLLLFLFYGISSICLAVSPIDFYDSSAVKKLGIKRPPKNRLKTDLSRPASEQELAAFLNKQASEHRDLSSRTVGLVRYIKPKFLAECINELNKIASSAAWKRLANSNISHVFHADVKKYKDEIHYGLSSVNSKLNDLEYEANEKSNRLLLASSQSVRTRRNDYGNDFRTNFHIINCPKCQAAGRDPVMTDEMFKQMEKIQKGFSPSLSKKQRNDNRRMRIFLNEHSPDDNIFYDKNGNAYDIGSCPDFDL